MMRPDVSRLFEVVLLMVLASWSRSKHACASSNFDQRSTSINARQAQLRNDGHVIEPATQRPSFSVDHDYEVLRETELYRNWRVLIQRQVKKKLGGRTIDFEVVGQGGLDAAVTIFVWNSTSKTATLIQEYHPGPHELLFGCAAGLIEAKHGHDNDDDNDETFSLMAQRAAEHELEEECQVAGGTWYELTSQPLAMDKYATTKIKSYLVVDPETVDDPRPLDDEEDINIVVGVSVKDVLRLVRDGRMSIVGACTVLLALEKLRELKEVA